MIKFIKNIIANSIRNKHMAKLKPNDSIIINLPEDYTISINGHKLRNYNYPVVVISNDPLKRKIWIEMKTQKDTLHLTLNYSSKEFSNFMLYNIYSKDFININANKTSKEEIEKQLEEAVKSSNFEMAKLLNEKLKNLP